MLSYLIMQFQPQRF